VKGPPVDLRPPIATMTARPVPALPDERQGSSYNFEPKFDGWRCLACHRANGRVALQSRHQKSLTTYFPEIATAVAAQVPAASVLDGELVVYHDGRCDFAALQRRITGRRSLASPVTFVAFDLLALAGRDLRGLPYRRRRKRLRRLLDGATPPLALTPATRERVAAQAWLRDYAAVGIEGVVIKHRQHGYRPGRRSSWWKVRSRTTADAVVGGVIGPLTAPEMLVLGLPDGRGRLRVAGRTAPLTLPAAGSSAPCWCRRSGRTPGQCASRRAGSGNYRRGRSTTRRRSRCWWSRSTPTAASSSSAGGTPRSSGASAATWNPPTWPDVPRPPFGWRGVAQGAGWPGEIDEGGGDHEVAAARNHPSVPRQLPAGHGDGNLAAVAVAAAVDGDRARRFGLVWGRSCSGASHVGTSDRGPRASQFGPREERTKRPASRLDGSQCKYRCTCSRFRRSF
jgi:ATP dependent DNA ligase-like protein